MMKLFLSRSARIAAAAEAACATTAPPGQSRRRLASAAALVAMTGTALWPDPATAEQRQLAAPNVAIEVEVVPQAVRGEGRLEARIMPDGRVVIGAAPSQPEPQEARPAETPGRGQNLTLADGQVLDGELAGMDQERLLWNSPLFDEVAEIDLRAVSSISVSKPVDDMSIDDPMVVSFTDGGRLYAELVAIDQQSVTIDSRRIGRVTLRRDQISSLQWLRQGDLLWSGPHGTTGWSYESKPRDGSAWRALPTGHMRTVGWHQDTQLKLDLPGLIEVEFSLAGEDGLRFELSLDVGGERGGIATWGDELVLLRGEDFVSLGAYNPDAPLTLRWFWDRSTQRGLVTDASGNPLGQWQADAERAGQMEEIGNDRRPLVYLPPFSPEATTSTEPPATPTGTDDPLKLPEIATASGSFTLKNRGPSLTLTNFKVRQWSGEDPQTRSVEVAEGPRVMMAGNKMVALTDSREITAAGGTLAIAAGPAADSRNVALGEVEGIWFQPSGQPTGQEQTKPGVASLRFADGAWWQGRVRSIADKTVVIATPYSDQPFEAAIHDLVALDLLHGADEAWLAEHMGGEDRLEIASSSLTGTWEPAAGKVLRWLLPGALKAVPVTARHEHEVTRPIDAESRQLQTTLLHLTDGQILPGQVESIAADGSRVVLRSDLLEDVAVDSDRIRALQFKGEQLLIDGFNDGGWYVSGGKAGQEVVFDDQQSGRKVSLNPDGGYAHPGILLTNRFNFTMAVSPRGALRVRLFHGPDQPESITLVLAHTGNQLHCGTERGQNSFSSQGSLNLTGDEPVNIGISWDEQQIFVHVGEEQVAAISHELEGNLGRYLGFEMSDLWRATDSAIHISEFSLNPEHGMSSAPLVGRQAREEALLLPRFLRDDPPRQVLLAHNGDLLRGTIESGDAAGIRFRTGLRSYQIPEQRAAAAIWLIQPEKEGAGSAGDSEPQQGPAHDQSPFANSHTMLLHSGGALLVDVESFGPDFIEGTVSGIGPCRIPVDQIAEVQSGDRDLGAHPSLFAGWNLEKTPDPLPVASGQDGRTAPLVGQQAEDFELPLLPAEADGEEQIFKLSDQRGRVVVLDFWASWCAVCMRSLPEKIEAFSAYDPQKVTFLAVNQAEGEELVRWFLESRGWGDLKVAMDRDQAVGRSFQVGGLPHSVIIGPDGRIAWVSTGFRAGGSRALTEVVDSLLKDVTPDA